MSMSMNNKYLNTNDMVSLTSSNPNMLTLNLNFDSTVSMQNIFVAPFCSPTIAAGQKASYSLRAGEEKKARHTKLENGKGCLQEKCPRGGT